MIRIFDVVFSLIGMILLSPFWIIISLIIFFNDFHSVLYVQKRIGKDGKEFNLYKFRTMRPNSDKLGLLTVGGRDSRITPIGFYLRKYKLDELPQLLNVFIGNMSLVGPRPEVKKYVDLYTPEQQNVLKIRPGITDVASIQYMDENILLSNASDPEKLYIEKIMGDKIRLNMQYIKDQSIRNYFSIIFKTILKIVR